METRASRLVWAIGGAIIGSILSLVIDKIVLPYFEGKPNIEIVAERLDSGQAVFTILNSGNAEVRDVWLNARLTAALQARVDIISINPIEDDVSAKCSYTIGKSTFSYDASSTMATVLNTESVSLELRCDLMNPGDKWSANLDFIGTKAAVTGIFVHIKYPGESKNLYAIFETP